MPSIREMKKRIKLSRTFEAAKQEYLQAKEHGTPEQLRQAEDALITANKAWMSDHPGFMNIEVAYSPRVLNDPKLRQELIETIISE